MSIMMTMSNMSTRAILRIQTIQDAKGELFPWTMAKFNSTWRRFQWHDFSGDLSNWRKKPTSFMRQSGYISNIHAFKRIENEEPSKVPSVQGTGHPFKVPSFRHGFLGFRGPPSGDVPKKNCWKIQHQPRNTPGSTNIAPSKIHHLEDVFPIQDGDFSLLLLICLFTGG